MKILRLIVTIILAAMLFPVVFISLQYGAVYQTVYNPDFVEGIIDDSNVTGRIIHSLIDLTEEQVGDTMIDSQLPVDMDTLVIELTNRLESGDVEDSINDFIIGMHSYYFTEDRQLPTLNIDYLETIYSDIMVSMTNQIVVDNGLSDLSEVQSALEAGYNSGLINADAVDTAIDYLRNSDVEITNNDPELLIAFIEAYNDTHLTTSSSEKDLQETLNTVVLKEYLNIDTFPEEVDIESLLTKMYGDRNNPITALKSLTYHIPSHMFWLLLTMLLGLPMIYLLVHRLRIIGTLQFVSLIGLVASFISLFGSVIAYWFAPSGTIKIFMDVDEVPILNELLNFVDLLITRYMSEAIKINLIALITFVVVLIVTETIKRLLDKPDEVIETNTEIVLQLSSAAVIIAIMALFIRYETGQIRDYAKDYSNTINAYDAHEINTDIFYDLDALIE